MRLRFSSTGENGRKETVWYARIYKLSSALISNPFLTVSMTTNKLIWPMFRSCVLHLLALFEADSNQFVRHRIRASFLGWKQEFYIQH